MGAPEELGQVTEKWWQTKKILDWTYKTPLTIAGPLFEKLGAPVATVSLEQSRANDEEDKIWFVARSEWFGGKRATEIRDRTLEGLRTKVATAFRDMILAHTAVKWEDWLELEISEREVRAEEKKGNASINVEYKVLKRARFPDGRDMVFDSGSLNAFPKAKAAGVDADEKRERLRSGHWGNHYYQDTDHQFAYIRATPENLAAVIELMAKLGQVNDRLMALLTQASIANTVKLLTGNALRLEDKR